MAATKETISEARDRVLTHRAKLHEQEVLDQKHRVEALHKGVAEFVQAMNVTYPKGIQVDSAVAFDSANGLDEWVRGALHAEYLARKGASTGVRLLAADHSGEPGITLAVVNLNVPESSKNWILVSADLRTVEGGIGFHIYNQIKKETDRIITNQSLLEADIEKHKKDQFELTKTLLGYSEPLLAFAAEEYKKAVADEVARHPLRNPGGSGISTN